MAENSAIQWTDATFNAWWGCTKVGQSPACDHCYAETFARRVGFSDLPNASQFPIWGDDARRRYFGDKHWNEPLRWNRSAEKSGVPKFVFSNSMSDWAEGRTEQKSHLERLWKLQSATPWLRWLMLTKRPQLINSLRPRFGSPVIEMADKRVWHGITTETQKWFDIRWRHLREVYSLIYWLSIEPLFEKLVLPKDFLDLGPRAWVIVGGESGAGFRPIDPAWVRSLRDQCVEAGVVFHFKQWSGLNPKKLGNLLDGRVWQGRPCVERPIIPASEHRSDEFHEPEPER